MWLVTTNKVSTEKFFRTGSPVSFFIIIIIAGTSIRPSIGFFRCPHFYSMWPLDDSLKSSEPLLCSLVWRIICWEGKSICRSVSTLIWPQPIATQETFLSRYAQNQSIVKKGGIEEAVDLKNAKRCNTTAKLSQASKILAQVTSSWQHFGKGDIWQVPEGGGLSSA